MGKRPPVALLLIAGSVALAAMLAGCSSPALEDSVGPFKADFDHAMADEGTTEFQRTILKDYEITDAEYSEARNKFKACIEDEGYVLILDDGSTRMEGIQPDEHDLAEAVFTRCQDEFLIRVEPLYYELRENPDNEDRTVLLTDCLKRAGLLDEEVSAEEFLRDPEVVSEEDPIYNECALDPNGAFRT